MFTETEFRQPWFRIISVREKSGRSMADIAKDILQQHCVNLATVRGPRGNRRVVEARRAVITKIYEERPDLSSNQVAAFLGCDGSSVRHLWRGLRAMEAL